MASASSPCATVAETRSTGPSGRRAATARTEVGSRSSSMAAASKKCTPCSTKIPPLTRLVPEPVAGVEVLVAGVVLEAEALHRAEQGAPQPGQRAQQRVVAEHVVDDQHPAGALDGRDQVRGVGVVEGERLLAEHVLAGLERRPRDLGVTGRRRGHDDGVDVVVGQQVAPRRGRPGAVRPRQVAGRVGPGVRDGAQRHRGSEAAASARKVAKPPAPTSPRPTTRRRRHPLTPDPRSEAVKCFWKATNSATAGAASTTAPARMAPNGFAARPAHVADVVGQGHRQRLQVRVLRHQERPQELVPRPDEREQRRGEQGRTRQGQRDRPQDPQLARAVEARRREQLLGQRQEELPEDEDRGRVDRERHDHPEVGVRQPVAAHDHHVDRDDQQLERHDLHQQHRREQRALAAEVQPRQRVAGQDPEDDRAEEDAAGEDAGVDQRPDRGRSGR